MIFLASLIYIVATVCIGTLISTFARNQQQAMMGSFLFLFPAVLMSGLMFPLENMPRVISLIALVNPLKYYMVLLRHIMLKGADPFVMLANIGALVLICAIAVLITAKRFKTTI